MIEIGTFEAKTHFSEVIRRVRQGESFCVTHRGEKVAIIKKAKPARKAKAEPFKGKVSKAITLESLKRNEKGEFIIDDNYKKYTKKTVGAWLELRKTSPIKATLEEIIAWKNEGRP